MRNILPSHKLHINAFGLRTEMQKAVLSLGKKGVLRELFYANHMHFYAFFISKHYCLVSFSNYMKKMYFNPLDAFGTEDILMALCL